MIDAKKHSRSGYIMVLSLIFISTILIFVTHLFNQARTHSALSSTMLAREKAKTLALSGVQIALSQLNIKEEKKDLTSEKPFNKGQKLLEQILPVINRWQLFNITKEKDGLEGEIKVCLSCEDGKLNLNHLFDFKKKSFKGKGQLKGDMQVIMSNLMARLKEYGIKDIFVSLLDFLEKRGYQLNDVTELLADEKFATFAGKVFYEPPETNGSERSVYLTDLFTVWSDSMKIEPWLLSDSLSAVLGLKRAQPGQVSLREQQGSQWAQQLKLQASWKADWNKTLQPLYGKAFDTLPTGVDTLLTTRFDPTAFCVVSYGTVSRVTQRVYAVIKKEQKADHAFKIKKLYWI